MSNPSKVVFFDITGTWDPSLMFVMGGAILVSLYPFHYVQIKVKESLAKAQALTFSLGKLSLL